MVPLEVSYGLSFSSWPDVKQCILQQLKTFPFASLDLYEDPNDYKLFIITAQVL